MIRLVKLALAAPYTIVVMAVLILIFGVSAALRTPVDIFPGINVPVISSVFSYSGLSPDDMAGRVVTYYERALSTTVNNIEHIESQSVPNYGIVKIYFQPSVNINAAMAQVTSVSQTVLKQMPAGITPPLLLSYDASSVPIIQLALSSKTLSETTLFDQASSFIRPQLASVAGAAIPLPYGGKVRQVEADLNPQALHQYGLSANDVSTALAMQNLIIPVGTQKIGAFEYTVSLNDSPTAIADFNNLPIKTVNGAVIYMRQVAFVHDGSPPQTNVVHVDGQSAVLLSVIKNGATSTLAIISGIKNLLPQIKSTLPAGLNITTTGDQSGFVISAVTGVVREALIAGCLTGLMILMFLGSWRSTLMITISIPLAILSAIAVLSALGQTINIMTLGGLALAVGILVDDATVNIENINRHLERGDDIESAILGSASQVVQPATVSLLCISIAFLPMLTLSGVSGFLFRPLAEAVIFALVASYLLSLTLVPTMAHAMLGKPETGAGKPPGSAGKPGLLGWILGPLGRWIFGPLGRRVLRPLGRRIIGPLGRMQRSFDARFEAVRESYTGLLALALRHQRRVLIGFLGFSLLSFCLAPVLGQDFFPSVDGGQINIHMRAQTGTRIEDTTSLTNRVRAAINQIIPPAELGSVVDNIGLSVSGINMAYNNSGTIGTEDADILVSLKPHHGSTSGYVRRMREVLPRQFPGVSFSFLPADMVSQILNFGAPAPIDLQVVGNDMAADRQYAQELLARIKLIPGVADPRIQQAFQEPTLNVNVNRSLAGLVGINERDAANAMLTTLAGSSQVSPTYWLNPKTGVSYPVEIQMPQQQISTLGGLQNLPVTTGSATSSAISASGVPGPGGPSGPTRPGGATGAAPATGLPVLLGGLADIQRSPTNALVSHYNVRPVIDIYATPQGRDLGGVANDIRKVMKDTAHQVPKGAIVTLRGQVTTMGSAYQQLFVGLALALVLIYLLIVVNFQSWVDPLVIVIALPTALAGIVWMLFATGTTLSVPALTGTIMCMGVATANSILLISFARERMAAGVDPVEAALEAGSTRFRPVMMTALAMILGMLPMAIEPTQNTPLGRAVIGGLLFATCATLILVPTVFSLVHSRARKPAEQPVPPASLDALPDHS